MLMQYFILVFIPKFDKFGKIFVEPKVLKSPSTAWLGRSSIGPCPVMCILAKPV